MTTKKAKAMAKKNMTTDFPPPGGPQRQNASVPGLSIPQLETVYDTLAEAIDQAGPQQSELFLTKLCLLLANRIGNDTAFACDVKTALNDLTPSNTA
jgi:Protein of unknown function (DUF2783)